MKHFLLLLTVTFISLCAKAAAPATDTQHSPLREFRGAWLHTVFQDQYSRQSTAENKRYLLSQLDKLQAIGINAVIFQVRPSADAFYKSKLEPWSRFLTGTTGKAPTPAWDPLQFMIDECHSRGMEIHAWLNPYRVTTSAKEILPTSHIARKHPERVVRYAGKLYFDPGQPENIDFIVQVVSDIVKRYDIDGIHFDDYFYPYPVKKQPFPDYTSYKKYGHGMPKDDWRRQNVDRLIKQVNVSIKKLKPWVRFGISPFGIWRNAKSDPDGSATDGLQNYDDLYADVPKWAANGWIDYQMPQVYWNTDFERAPYHVLVDWWNRHSNGRHVYIGQSVQRTEQGAQLNLKVRLTRDAENITGNCWWPGYDLTNNKCKVSDSLATVFHNTPSIVPEYTWLSDAVPKAVESLTFTDGVIKWQSPPPTGTSNDVIKWAIYRFDDPEEASLASRKPLISIVGVPEYKPTESGYYIITAINRVNTESGNSLPFYIE